MSFHFISMQFKEDLEMPSDPGRFEKRREVSRANDSPHSHDDSAMQSRLSLGSHGNFDGHIVADLLNARWVWQYRLCLQDAKKDVLSLLSETRKT